VRLALLQIAMGVLNWSLMSQIIACFLPRTGDVEILAALLLAAVASAIVHIPAGIGVLETVFIALLGHATPTPHLIAALLAYRACYYLAPLGVATVLFAWIEMRGRSPHPRALH
jgi:hypothetical protein